MRLLFLNHNYRFGGTYCRAMPMAEQLAARGHQVTLLTVSRDQRWTARWSVVNGVRLGEMPNFLQNNSGEGYGPFDNVRRIVHGLAHHYDLIHMFDHKPNATFAGFTGRLRGAKLVADWADWWGGPGGINDIPQRRIPAVGKFEGWWEVRSKQWADRVVTISSVLRQRALDFGIPPDHILHLPTGAAIDRISPISVSEARLALNIPIERQIVGFIGSGQGDLEIVMRALQELPEVWLMVIGPPHDSVRNQARQLGLENRLWQTGFIPDGKLNVYLCCANAMVLPLADRAANRGRLPNKLLDYMAAGRATVANPIGDVQSIVNDHRVGLLANDDGFAAALNRLLTDAALCAELGRNARRTAETEYNWSHLSDRLEAFYKQVLTASHR